MLMKHELFAPSGVRGIIRTQAIKGDVAFLTIQMTITMA